MGKSRTLVLYYSRKGSNRYLAEKLSEELNAEIEPISPLIRGNFLLIIFSLLKIGVSPKSLKNHPADFERIILCSPIWMGQVVSPLRGFLNRYGKECRSVDFITCCGSSDEGKLDKFGYATVFSQIEKVLGERYRSGTAFPVQLALPEEQRGDGQAVMNTVLNESNFQGGLQDRFVQLLKEL